MPANHRLNINETFESQKDSITTKIIPALLKVLNPATYPISEGVLYEMIHQRHRHQREEMIRKNKAEPEQVKESIRRHGNSRRNEVTKHQ